ncbi:MAG: PAS domain-containing protein [Eubacterium sp.]
MAQVIKNTEKILHENINGFHQYILQEPIHLGYVSRNLCNMIGTNKEQLLDESEDLYASFVHPDDREDYCYAIKQLSLNDEETVTLQYRIVKADGCIIYISDTIYTDRLDDGTLVGNSVLTDITNIKAENRNIKFLNETIPCGFMRYTCEKQPKITYINDSMLKMLNCPENKSNDDLLDMYKENIYLLIPLEERRRFSLYLKRVYSHAAPLAGEMTLLRFDGTKIYVFGWVTKCINEQGEEEFQSVCMDISERYYKKKDIEMHRYIEALTDVYDTIFEYNFKNSTVKCLYSQKSSMFKSFENISMQMKDAIEKYINNIVYEDDRQKVSSFLENFYKKRSEESKFQPMQLKYRAWSSNGRLKDYSGIFLKIDDSTNLFCCRNIPDDEVLNLLKKENESLKSINENMQEIVMHFTDGIAAFEISDGFVRPLYSSDNVCTFFGYSKEEWLLLMKKRTYINEFISHSSISTEKIAELLKNGEAEFTYIDLNTNIERRIKAISSQRNSSGSSSDSSPYYVMLYNVDNNTSEEDRDDDNKKAIYIRTFGYFDVFVGDRPIAFRSQKSKELFALLVDRRGGYVSSEEAISFLWEDEPSNSVTLARYRKVALRLKNILEEYGISDVIESVDGKRRIVIEKVQCDLYDYLSGKEEFSQLFKGNYLTNYSWGETTLGELSGEKIF